jgi:membrane protease YdiL (CAAX protease family)
VNEPGPHAFARDRHLLLALVACALFMALVMCGPAPARLLLRSDDWTPEASLLGSTLGLLSVAIPAWIALAMWDTRSGVTVWPRRWASLGKAPFVLFAIMLAIVVGPRFALSPTEIRPYAYQSLGAFIVESEVAWVWLIARTSFSVLTEELLYRVMLQRALEAYIGEWPALFGQAVVFQLAHTYVYGYEFTLHHGFAGLVFGLIFMRTRSLAAPWLFHLANNLISSVILTWGVPL